VHFSTSPTFSSLSVPFMPWRTHRTARKTIVQPLAKMTMSIYRKSHATPFTEEASFRHLRRKEDVEDEEVRVESVFRESLFL